MKKVRRKISRTISTVEDGITAAGFISSQALGRQDGLGESAALSPTQLILDADSGKVVGVVAKTSDDGVPVARFLLAPNIRFEEYMMEFVPKLLRFEIIGNIKLQGVDDSGGTAEITDSYVPGMQSATQGGARPRTDVEVEVEYK